MYSLAALALFSFLLALVLTPLCRNRFRQWGWVDRPDSKRKLHSQPVPRAGGVPIMIAYIGAFAVLLASPMSAAAMGKTAPTGVENLLGCSARIWGRASG